MLSVPDVMPPCPLLPEGDASQVALTPVSVRTPSPGLTTRSGTVAAAEAVPAALLPAVVAVSVAVVENLAEAMPASVLVPPVGYIDSGLGPPVPPPQGQSPDTT